MFNASREKHRNSAGRHQTVIMVVRWLLATGLLLSAWPSFAADGTFQGKVIDTPAREQSIPGWIFIQGRNHTLRRVEVAHATIFLGRHGDRRQRRCNLDCLSIGQEILITAEQDPSGEWHAKRVEILWPLVNRSAIRRGAPEATVRPVDPSTSLEISPCRPDAARTV